MEENMSCRVVIGWFQSLHTPLHLQKYFIFFVILNAKKSQNYFSCNIQEHEKPN
jgi:hypothetical protein